MGGWRIQSLPQGVEVRGFQIRRSPQPVGISGCCIFQGAMALESLGFQIRSPSKPVDLSGCSFFGGVQDWESIGYRILSTPRDSGIGGCAIDSALNGARFSSFSSGFTTGYHLDVPPGRNDCSDCPAPNRCPTRDQRMGALTNRASHAPTRSGARSEQYGVRSPDGGVPHRGLCGPP
jgi:hypothetical protein